MFFGIFTQHSWKKLYACPHQIFLSSFLPFFDSFVLAFSYSRSLFSEFFVHILSRLPKREKYQKINVGFIFPSQLNSKVEIFIRKDARFLMLTVKEASNTQNSVVWKTCSAFIFWVHFLKYQLNFSQTFTIRLNSAETFVKFSRILPKRQIDVPLNSAEPKPCRNSYQLINQILENE